jgi:hypothetical protein
MEDGLWWSRQKKEEKEKGGRAVKKRERQQGWERKIPTSIQGPRVNLGRASAVHRCSGCDSRELESNLQAPAV